MASFTSFGFAALFILAITSSSPAATAAEGFKVGGDEGWRQPAANDTEMYTRWASTMRFHVGDSLRFVYKNDSVVVVDKWGYYHCNSTHPISVFDDGNTVFNLGRPGPAYFVSSDPVRCKNGQRLNVEVISLMHDDPISRTPAPAPFSGAGSNFLAMPQLVFFYVVIASASINNMYM
ncbi:hypothetical protein ABFS82_09G107300 [Erythranthe guttata]|uniref:Phytocyanin domain-containing protein n=1 Tax=Erythranthe guttata TaxID=4155 RepID=A0A022Q2S5_ERYGU|nr:PREDICTED: mavicyanin-like [Erythranthe guttata]EYU21493.1 hypothetical protein MIMGU_mgv1a014842mg [Erythranthe guttata]|eukprot:XP_012856113.1 PREDICTED: mavicyanin-like [Erythranthe guttata]